MKINPPPESKRKRETEYINTNIDGGLAKYQSFLQSKLQTHTMVCQRIAALVFFCKKRNQERYRTNVQLQLY
jgi:hypothetical protein